MKVGRGRVPRAAGLLTTLAAGFAAAGCMPGGPPRNIAIWVVGGEDELAADTPPSPENDVYSASRGEVRVDAALNETLAFQIVFRTTVPPAGPFEVRVGDLRGASSTLAASAVAARYRVHYARVDAFRSWYPAHTGRPTTPTLFPDILVPWDAPRGGGPLTLSEARNEIVWLDLHIPLTTSPGEYVGRLEVMTPANGTPVFACRLHVNVLPVALPSRRSVPVVCRVDPTDLLVAHLRWPRQPPESARLLPTSPGHLAAVRLVSETMQMFQAHGTTPVLWASFPKFRPVGERAVEVQWDEYDALVAGWLDGTAFANGVRLEVWPLPVAANHPDADLHGGLDSPQYARVLLAYLAECRRHFAERGWLDRAVVRPEPPGPLSHAGVDRYRRLGGILRQPEWPPMIAHLPPRSLRGLGWHDTPTIELADVGVWAPPALWFEPETMARERKLGRQTWLMPAFPPYSGSLAIEAPATDARALPWQAYRYEAAGMWIEQAACAAGAAPGGAGWAADDLTITPADKRPAASAPWAGAGLIYAGEPYGLRDRPVPSGRLKRLRRGLEDVELLRLLEANGQQLLARELAEQVVRWAGTDACLDNLLHCKPAGWPRSPGVFRLARSLLLHELAAQFAPGSLTRQRRIDTLARWGVLLSQRDRPAALIEGVRLTADAAGWRAHVLGRLENLGNRPIAGRWALPAPLPDWELVSRTAFRLEPGTRRPVRLELSVPGLVYNIDGVYPFELALEADGAEARRIPARLAVAVCPRVEIPLRIDGRLDDWPLAANNTAGDFRLNRAAPEDDAPPAEPARATRAFFALDREHFYVGVRCALLPGETPQWLADNEIPLDGALPWGQDVVEVLLDPRGEPAGSARDIYALQVKPTGLLIARQGCRTEPPMGPSLPWPSGARAAVTSEREGWVVEIAVPLSALPPEARRQPIWGVNVTRLDAARGEYSSWSGVCGMAYRPSALGNLIMLWP